MSKRYYDRKLHHHIPAKPEDKRTLLASFNRICDAKIHGISFSPYIDDQGPGSAISKAQISERIKIIVPFVKWVRTFSCTDGNEHIPEIAKSCGLKTMVGAWIDDDRERNELELKNAIEATKAGHVDILAIGNEVLLRDEISEVELIDYIERAKAAVGDTPVGYVDAYFKFEDHPRVAAACETILVNCYPFWEGYPAEHAHIYMREMYRRAQRVAGGKKVVIAETGWPNVGTPEESAIPSVENALKYFIEAYQWAEEEGIDIFYFSSFDESWKVEKEGDVGAFWGLWDKDGAPKYSL
ncbi:MAG: glycosyl hydrolase family 17 protein [Aquisalinus sp.]|nr:glycosyl hydrolase family 17 protein [Aquisalinus sp.]